MCVYVEYNIHIGFKSTTTLELIEELLDGQVPLQCHAKVTAPTVRVRVLKQEQDRLHVLKVRPRARCIFLTHIISYGIRAVCVLP